MDGCSLVTTWPGPSSHALEFRPGRMLPQKLTLQPCILSKTERIVLSKDFCILDRIRN